MDFDKENLITIDGVEYYVLLKEKVNDIFYLYVAELDEDGDINENFYLYEEKENHQWERVTDSSQLKEKLPAIIKLLNEKLG